MAPVSINEAVSKLWFLVPVHYSTRENESPYIICRRAILRLGRDGGASISDGVVHEVHKRRVGGRRNLSKLDGKEENQ